MSSIIKYDKSKRKKFVNEIKNEFYDMPLSEKKNHSLKNPI